VFSSEGFKKEEKKEEDKQVLYYSEPILLTMNPESDIVNVIKRLSAAETDSFMKQVTEILRKSRNHYSWVGIYMVKDDSLVLRAFSGEQETEHTRIKIGEGICGLAAQTGNTIMVPDVSRDLRYIACFPSTKSEIVVPIKIDRRIVGEIDIDSDSLNVFTAEDKALLEEVARVIAEKLEKKV